MKKILYIVLCIYSEVQLSAQYLNPNVISSSGTSDKQNTNNISISSTVGQVNNGSFTNASMRHNIGFQQSGIHVRKENLPGYEIGYIPSFNIHSDVETAFYFKSDSLGNTVNRSIEYDKNSLKGSIVFNPTIGKFTIVSDKEDKGELKVIFKAKNSKDSVYQEVVFNFSPTLDGEHKVFGLQAKKGLPSESDEDYINITEYNDLSNVSISGKTLIFDKSSSSKLTKFITTAINISELNIYAEKIIIRSFLHFPKANITIHARVLRFENNDMEFSAISTTPHSFPTSSMPKIDGKNGEKAGNIILNIEKFESDPGNRFILVGGTGQDGNEAKAGSGGSGGEIKSTADIDCYYDIHGGAAGRVSSSYIQGLRGPDGKYTFLNNIFSWLHPNFLRPVLNHSKSAYLNGHLAYCDRVYFDYTNFIDKYRIHPEWGEVMEQEKREFDQLRTEMYKLLMRIRNNLDYFGNPAGWVPMLSFEINKIAFEQEIDRAMNILYLAYKLQKAGAKNDEKMQMVQNAIKEQENLYTSNQKIYEEAVDQLPFLISSAEDISKEIEDIKSEIEKIDELLSERAKYIVEDKHRPPKKSWWKKAANVIGAVANAIPVFQPALGVIGTGIQTVANINWQDPVGAITSVVDQVTKFKMIPWGESANNLKMTFKQLDFSKLNVKNPSEVKEYYDKIRNVADPIYDEIIKLKNNVGEVKVPIEEIKIELDRIRAESPEYQELAMKATVLMEAKAELEQKSNITLQKIASSYSGIQNAIVAKEGLNIDAFNLESKKDLKVLNFVKEMEINATERLLKFHYYMSKAYEFRLLESYNFDLETTKILERIRTTIEGDKDNELSDEEFKKLKGFYDQIMGDIVKNILDKYNINAPAKRAYRSFQLDSVELLLLNKNGSIVINLVEREALPINEENLRIVDLRIKKENGIKVHSESNNQGNAASIDLSMEHSGRSRIKSNSEIYLFNHYTINTVNPIIWKSRYDFNAKDIQNIQPSPSVISLLRSLFESKGIPINDENLIIYSRPGAWAEIIVSRTITPTNAKLFIDSLTLEVQYDFNMRASNVISLNVMANKELKPYIRINIPDKNNRQDSYGTFVRTFFRSTNRSVKLEAPKEYGSYKFDNWSTFSGDILNNSSIIEVPLNEDQNLRANYILIQPVLQADDTIYVSKSGGMSSFTIENKGNGFMDWRISKQNLNKETWYSINSNLSGINNANINLSIDPNNENSIRTGKVIIIAPTSMDYLDTVTIIQNTTTTPINIEDVSNWISVFPNPNKGILTIDIKTHIFNNINILNSRGEYLKTIKVNQGFNNVNLSELSSGLYFIIGKEGNKRIIKKFSKI